MIESWIDTQIEERIRPQVKLLRDNGFNTECSCGHEMYVQCQMVADGELMRLHKLLFNNGYRDYSIDVNLEVIDGHSYCRMEIKFKKQNNRRV